MVLGLGLFVLVTGGADELALQVVDVALVVEEVLLVVALDLDPPQPLLSQVLRVVHVDHVLVVALATLSALLGRSLLLERQDLALSEALVVDGALVVRVLRVADEDAGAVLLDIALDLLPVLDARGELVDLVLDERVLPRRIHHQLRVVVQGHPLDVALLVALI